MKRIVKAVFYGVVVGAICIGLVALPNAFNPHDDENIGQFNQRLQLVWFLGLSMPGLVISLLLGLVATRRRLEKYAVAITWSSAVVLAVALPAPAILGEGGWADGLILWYVSMGFVIGCILGWSPVKSDRNI